MLLFTAHAVGGFKMVDRHRAIATIGGGVLIIIILWLLAHRSQAIVNNMNVSHPVELRPDFTDGPTYDGGSYSFGPVTLGTINLNQPSVQSGGCGCGCSAPNGAFADAVTSISNRYVQGLDDLQGMVADAYLASIPPYVSQFFNNSQATQNYSASSALFSDPYSTQAYDNGRSLPWSSLDTMSFELAHNRVLGNTSTFGPDQSGDNLGYNYAANTQLIADTYGNKSAGSLRAGG